MARLYGVSLRETKAERHSIDAYDIQLVAHSVASVTGKLNLILDTKILIMNQNKKEVIRQQLGFRKNLSYLKEILEASNESRAIANNEELKKDCDIITVFDNE